MAEITYFDYDRSQLTDDENAVVDALMDAGTVIHNIWQKQVDLESNKFFVYPEGVSKEEIEEAAKSDPLILDPFTVVKREGDKLVAVPYKDEYADDLEEFYQHMMLAAENTSEEPLRDLIETTVNSFKEGDYLSALIAYLENPDTKIEFLVGPIESYEDEMFAKKKTFQFNLRVLKEDSTDEVTQMIDVMKNIRLPQPDTSLGSKLVPSSIKVRLDDTLMFSGRQSTMLVSSTNLPNESALVKEHGTKVVVYTTSMNKKFEERHEPLLPSFVDLDLDKDPEGMKKAIFRFIALHEIAEATVKFVSMEKRMGRNYDTIRELNGYLVGLDSAKYQLMNGVITIDEYQNLLTALLTYAIDVANAFEQDGRLAAYAKGFAVMFNFLTEGGSVEFNSGNVIVDFVKMTRDIEKLSNITIAILEDGDESDVDNLLAEYGDVSIFQQLPKPQL